MKTTQQTMKRLLLLFCVLSFGINLQAQLSTLRFVPNSFEVHNLSTGLSASDTLYTSFGDTLEYRARVIFSGPSSITDDIGFGISTDTLMTVNADSIYLSTPQIDTLNNNDTLTIIIRDQVDSIHARYSGGTGGGAIAVVVWPVLRLGSSMTDGTVGIIFNFADRPASTGPEFPLALRTQCFPNPIQGRLFFQEKQSFSKFEYVRIQDLLGRRFFESKELPTSIQTAHWPSGLYLIEIRYRDGIKEFFKIEKQ